MAFLLFRSGKQIVRSPSWAAPPKLVRVLTSNNCFSTDASSSSSGGMIQASNPNAEAALKADMPVTAEEAFGYKFLSALLLKTPLPPPDDPDYHNFVDDILDKLPTVHTVTKSETDKNPKPFTPEEIKANSVLADAITFGFLNYIPKPPAFKDKGDNFSFTRDTKGLDLIVNVSGLPKEDLVVCVDRHLVLVASIEGVAPEQEVGEGITMPDDHNYDPAEVTGTIMEDGQLKISFPVSKEGGEPEEKYFEVNLV